VPASFATVNYWGVHAFAFVNAKGEKQFGKWIFEYFLSAEIPRHMEVNANLQDDPASVNNDCYGTGWMIKVRLSADADMSHLMDAAAYEAGL
jgi:catalase